MRQKLSHFGQAIIVVGVCLYSDSSTGVEADPFESITSVAGVEMGMVHSIAVDDGAVWLGADNGLFGIVGDKQYFYGHQNSELVHPVFDVFIAEDHSHWLATYGGGLKYIEKNTKNITAYNVSDGLRSDFISTIDLISDGIMLVSGILGPQIFIESSSNFISISKYFSIEDEFDGEYSATTVGDGLLYVIRNNEVYVLNVIDKSFEVHQLPDLSIDNVSIDFVKIESDALWVATEQILVRLDLSLNTKQIFTLKEENLVGTFDVISKKKQYYIASDGLLDLDLGTGAITSTKSVFPFGANKTINVIHDLAISYSDIVLLGGPVFGLSWLPRGNEAIRYLHKDMVPIKGKISSYIESWNGKSLLLISGVIYEFSASEYSEVFPSEINGKYSELIQHNGILWGVDYDGKVKSILVGEEPKEIEDIDNIVDVSAIKENLLLLNEDKQMFISTDTNTFAQVSVDFFPDLLLSAGHSIFAIDYFNGVFISEDGIRWKRLNTSSLKESNAVDCAAKTITGTIYFCTSGDGIVTISPETSRIVESKLNSKIDSKYIRDIVADGSGYLWIASNTGLYRADPEGNWAQKLTKKEGVIDIDFEYEGIHLNASKDRLLVVGDKLNYVFDLTKLNEILNEDLQKTNQLLITDIRNFAARGEDKGYLASYEEGSESPLAIIENDVYLTEINFAANDVIDHQFLNFEYRLVGLSSQWRLAPFGNASATFSTLPFGTYTFQARAIDKNSLVTQPILTRQIKVMPPSWLTFPAFMGYVLAFIVLYNLIAFWQRRAARIKQADLDKTLQKQETKFVSRIDELNSKINSKANQFATISQEIRTPLTIILGWLSSLQGNNEFEEHRKSMQAMVDNGERIKMLVDQLLDLEELDAKITKENRTYNVEECLTFVVESFKASLKSKCLSWKVSCKPRLFTQLPYQTLEKILFNVLSNAIKYTPEGGSVEVRARNKDSQIEITIKDTGIGIPEQDLERVFDRFTRLKQQSSPGSGIGLSIVKELIKSNAGAFELKSKVGVGTTFKFYFPAVDDSKVEESMIVPIAELKIPQYLLKNHQPQKSDDHESYDRASSKKKVLIVDDSEELREFMKSFLKTDYECIRAINGKEAFKLALKLIPDAIVSDVMLQVTNGIELTKRLRQNDITSNIPIILTSGKTDEETRIKALSAKADDFITKPFNPEEIKLKIKQFIDARELICERLLKQREDLLANPNIADYPMPEFESEREQRFYLNLLVDALENYKNFEYCREMAAEHLGCTERQINRKLNEYKNQSFTTFLREFRLYQAKKLLDQSSDIADVAYEVGFSSPSYFGSRFKAAFGITPSQYIQAKLPNSDTR